MGGPCRHSPSAINIIGPFKPAPPGAQENLHATYGHLRTLVAYKLRTGNNFLQSLACSLMLISASICVLAEVLYFLLACTQVHA